MLDIEGSRRYFESQSRENQDIRVSEEVKTNLFILHYQRKKNNG